ncbi:hypothetical protein [Micromonospora globispora]|uniref:hypothetical protein n=1 Tax=Micromonospora globispora TaxID=1450148 RepID=UPI000F4FE0AC|nr:hypothetical protein [Micromonospora globispora]
MEDERLVDIGRPGSRVTLRLGEFFSPNATDADLDQRAWRYADIEVETNPFATFQTVLTGEDIQEYGSLARAFRLALEIWRRVAHGGDRECPAAGGAAGTSASGA